MVRSIVAVVVTYIVMCALVIGAVMGLWFGMGVERLLKPESWQGNTFLCIAAPAITVIGGLFGGWMCGKIGRGRGPVMALAALTLVVGLASMFFITLKKPFPADPREPGLTMEQIMEKGREPTWLAIFNPIAGAVMVVIGGMGAGGKRSG